MSYIVRYGTSKYDSSTVSGKKKRLILSICMFLAAILVCTLFSEQVRELRRHLFPALEPSVQQAFKEMTQSVREGESLHDAAVAFCREVLFETAG